MQRGRNRISEFTIAISIVLWLFVLTEVLLAGVQLVLDIDPKGSALLRILQPSGVPRLQQAGYRLHEICSASLLEL